jgi:hypothetical protein
MLPAQGAGRAGAPASPVMMVSMDVDVRVEKDMLEQFGVPEVREHDLGCSHLFLKLFVVCSLR